MLRIIESYKDAVGHYDATAIKADNSIFDSFYHIKIKKFFIKDSFFVAFCNLPFDKNSIKDVLAYFENYLNEENIDSKSLLCVFAKSADSSADSFSYYFSNLKNSFVHPLIICSENYKICFDEDFDYYGSRAIKKLANEIINGLK